MNKYNIILASSSPRRIEMIKKYGINPEIIKPDINEDIGPDLNLIDAVMFLALKKALYVEELILNNRKHLISSKESPSLIIAADTLVYFDKIIGKPNSKEEAFSILASLNGNWHKVITGVALLEPGGIKRKVFYEITQVKFKKYKDENIIEYINTQEPYDKAGGYAIQGYWGKYVDQIEGDFDNVIGFPITRIFSEIETL